MTTSAALFLALLVAIVASIFMRERRPRKPDRLSDSAGEAHFAAQAQEEARRRA